MNKVSRTITTFLFALLLSMSSQAWAQEVEAPDYRYIRQVTSNSKSLNYYPRLMQQYLQNDTTLTFEQYRFLYYGFVLQEDFVPYKEPKEPLIDIRKKMLATDKVIDLCPEAIRIASRCLDDDPFDLTAMSTISLAYLYLGDTLSYNRWEEKMSHILDAIATTGDGENIENAIHVTSIAHEYEVINKMGLIAESDSLCNNQVEFLRVKENAEGIPGLFFNFGACNAEWKKRYETRK